MAERPGGIYNLETSIHELMNMSLPISHLIRSGAIVSGALWSIASVSVVAAQTVIRRLPPAAVTNAPVGPEREDLMDISAPPVTLAGSALGSKLTELGLPPNSVAEGETIRLTVVNPKQTGASFGLTDAATVSTASGQGWAGIRGGVTTRFNAESASRYLVDFSVGDHPGVPTTGTRRFGAWIFSDEGATAKVQSLPSQKGRSTSC